MLINDSTTHTIPASAGAGGAGEYATPIQSVANFQSFNLGIIAHCSSQSTAGGPLVMPVTITWFADAAGSFPVESDTYWMWLVSNSGVSPNYQLRGGGPAKGAYVVIAVANLSATATIAVTQITLIGNGRAISAARFNQPAPYIDISSGLTLLATDNEAQIQLTGYPDGSDGVLCNESGNTNIVAGSTYWLPMPLYTGPVSCRFSTSVALANDFVLATAAPLLNGNLAPGSQLPGRHLEPRQHRRHRLHGHAAARQRAGVRRLQGGRRQPRHHPRDPGHSRLEEATVNTSNLIEMISVIADPARRRRRRRGQAHPHRRRGREQRQDGEAAPARWPTRGDRRGA